MDNSCSPPLDQCPPIAKQPSFATGQLLPVYIPSMESPLGQFGAAVLAVLPPHYCTAPHRQSTRPQNIQGSEQTLPSKTSSPNCIPNTALYQLLRTEWTLCQLKPGHSVKLRNISQSVPVPMSIGNCQWSCTTMPILNIQPFRKALKHLGTCASGEALPHPSLQSTRACGTIYVEMWKHCTLVTCIWWKRLQQSKRCVHPVTSG